jgi:hypothetical protein
VSLLLERLEQATSCGGWSGVRGAALIAAFVASMPSSMRDKVAAMRNANSY